jgi:hypothetical protein
MRGHARVEHFRRVSLRASRQSATGRARTAIADTRRNRPLDLVTKVVSQHIGIARIILSHSLHARAPPEGRAKQVLTTG